MIAIITDAHAKKAAEQIRHRLDADGQAVTWIDASEAQVAPCTGCNGCLTVSFGRCVVRDAIDEILPALFPAGIVVWATRLTWGGFSGDIKKIVDKTALTGDRDYHVAGGELVKGSQTAQKKWCGIGVCTRPAPAEAAAFHALIRENGRILNLPAVSLILPENPDAATLEAAVIEVLS